MTIPKINSAHGSDTRNIINRAIDLINAQGKSIQDLVAEGQLTPSQYAELVSIINGNVKKGSITTADIDKNNFKIDQTMITDSLRRIITGDAPINAVPANNSIGSEELIDNSVTKHKKTVGGETASVLAWGKLTNIDMANKKITFFKDTSIVHSKNRENILTDTDVSFTPGLTTMIVYNTTDKTFWTSALSNANILKDDDIFVTLLSFTGTLQNELISVVGNLEYTVNGKNRIIKDSVHTSEIEDGAVTDAKTNFIDVRNYFNKEDVIHGITVEFGTGNEVENGSYQATKHIPMAEETELYLKDIFRISYFDENEDLINAYDPINTSTGRAVTSPKNTHSIRLTVHNNRADRAMIYKGTENRPYEPYGVKILGVDITKGGKNTDGKNIYFPPEPIEAKFIAPDYDYKTMSLEEYYTAFDELVNAYPDNLKKKVFGKDMSGQYDVIQYHYIPTTYTYESTRVDRPKPKITFISNVHGFEKPTALATYYMIKSMLEDWRSNDVIEYLRSNVEMVFIAIANPYGYVNGTYKNGNPNEPVNIQVNFPIHWMYQDPSTSVYGGTEPMSEKETQYISEMLEEHSDALFFVDSHSAGSAATATPEQMVYFITPSEPLHYNKIIEESLKQSVENISRELSKHYLDGYEGISGYYYLRPGNGTTEPYAATLGIPGYVSEIFYALPGESAYSPLSIKAMTETFANTLLTTLQTFKERM